MIKPLTSLRFIFALIVFLSHLEWVPAIDASFTGLYENIFQEGFLGVSFFFMLSGFILALNYKDRILQQKVTFKEFWIARIARIYALHVFTLIYSIPIFFPDFFAEPFFWLENFVVNLFLLQSFVPVPEVYFGFNAVSWSISNELFYYLMFPPLVLILSRFSKLIYVVIFLFLVMPIAIFFTPEDLQLFLFSINPLVRISDFIIGILLFTIFDQKHFSKIFDKISSASTAELCSILVFLFFFSIHNFIPVGFRFVVFYWIPMIFIIYVFAHSAGIFSRMLSNRFLVFLGKISFSFYMLHGLTMRYIKAWERRIDYSPNVYILIIFIFIVTVIISILSYYYLEQPANRRIRSLYRKGKEEKSVTLIVEAKNEVVN